MTPTQVTAINKKLENVIGVWANKFDTNKPYRVTTRFNREFTNYGNFSSMQAAAVVANIAGMAVFGHKALSNVVTEADQELPEVQAWMNSEKSIHTIEQAQINMA